MKKIMLIFLMSILMLSMVNALDFTSIDNFQKVIPFEKYGKVEVWDRGLFIIGEDTKLTSSVLNFNTDQCLVNCEAQPTITLYEEGSLIQDIRYLDENGNKHELEDSFSYKFEEEYVEQILNEELTEENCLISKNGTEQCNYNYVYKNVTKTRIIDKEYTIGEMVPAGTYDLTIKANKDVNQKLDWQIKVKGEWHTAWAWWDTDWDERITVNINNSNEVVMEKTTTINMTFNTSDLISGGKMLANCDDLRVIFNDTTELNRVIENCNNVDSRVIFATQENISISGNVSNYHIYYDNALATNPPENYYDDNIYLWKDNMTSNDGGWYGVGGHSDFSFGSSGLTLSGNDKWVVRNLTGDNFKIDFRMTDGASANWAGFGWRLNDNTNMTRFIIQQSGQSFFQETDGVSQAGSGTGNGQLYYNTNVVNDSVRIKWGATEPPTTSYGGWDFDDLTLRDNLNKIGFGKSNSGLTVINFTIQRKYAIDPVVFIGDPITPGITVIQSSPIDGFNTTDTTPNFVCNSSISGTTGISNVTIFIYDSSNNLDYTDVSDAGDAISYNKTWTSSALTDDTYNWACYAQGNDTRTSYAGNRSITIDSTAPLLNITLPVDGSTITDELAGDSATARLNYTVSDANLQTCWYYNQTANVTVTCGTNATFSLPYGTYTHYVYANDSLGNEVVDSSTATYDFIIKENSQTFSSSVVEGALEDFALNVTISPTVEIASATLIYNITNSQLGTITSSGQERILEVSSFQIPDFTTDVNITFYWNIVLNDATEINSSIQNQSVSSIELDNCTANSNKLFTVNLFDEELLTPLIGTIEIFYDVLNKPSYTSIQSFSGKFDNISSTDICSGINLTEQNLAYSAEVRYYADEYATELYNVQKTDITSIVPNISLYDLLLNDTTEFTINYENENVVKIPGAIVQLQRRYVSEDLWRTVEAPITGEGGKAVVHIDLDTNRYRAVVVKDGVVLDVFENIVFECENELSGQCSQNLFALIDAQNSVSIEQLQDFAYSISETNGTVTTVFSIPSGLPSTVNIQLSQTDQFGNTTLCNKTIISSGGSIDCDYETTIGESYLKLIITKDSVPQAINSYIIKESGAIDFLNNNFFIVLVLFLSLIGMAISTPEWIILNGVMTFLIAGSLWLLNGLNFVIGLGGLMWLIVAAGILIMKVAKQEDR